jgi:hypothetical protein
MSPKTRGIVEYSTATDTYGMLLLKVKNANGNEVTVKFKKDTTPTVTDALIDTDVL